MTFLLVVLYVIVCAFLILVVLLQSGKAGDLASAFGATSSQTAFGSRGTANFLSKSTTVLAALFMLLSLGLTILQVRKSSSSILKEVPGASGPAASAPAAASESAPIGASAPAPEAESAPASPSGPSPAPAPGPARTTGAP